MALTKLFLSLVLVLSWTFFCCCCFSSMAVARDAPPSLDGRTLEARLQEGSSSMECWNSLMELRACTGEVILFFMNGETQLGPSCCYAIRVIEHQCWPTMLLSLGFTYEEGDLLRDSCDANGADSQPTPPPPQTPPVEPTASPSSAHGANVAP